MSSLQRFKLLSHTEECLRENFARASRDSTGMEGIRCIDQCQLLRSMRDHAFGTEQQPPRNTGSRDNAQDGVIADIEERKQLGLARYGQLLQSFDGRDALRDLYEELLDASIYLKKAIHERERVDRLVATLQSLAHRLTVSDDNELVTRYAAADEINRVSAQLEALYPR